MNRQHLRALALIAWFTVAVLSTPSAKAGDREWHRVTSPNFVVISDAGEKRARGVAEQLEGFRALLVHLFPNLVNRAQPDKLVVVAFRNDASFKPFKPLYNGKPGNMSGVFLKWGERTIVALDASADQSSYRVVFHEYMHRLLSAGEEPVPLWFNEGIAEFYSTASTRGLKGNVGKVIDEHLLYLNERGMMPLDRLFGVVHDSPEYNERNKQGVFYAQSWLFIHYMLLSDNGTHQKQLVNFVAKTRTEKDVRAAFASAMGVDIAQAQKLLGAYLRQPAFPILNLTFDSAIPITEATAEQATAAEVEYQLGSVLALQGRHADAETRLREALKLDPKSALPYEGLGLIALHQGKADEARVAFTEAVSRDSKSYLANYYFARASMDTSDGAGDPAVVKALERAIELNPAFPGSYHLLSSLAGRNGEYQSALQWAYRGLKVAPQDNYIRYALASAQMASKQFVAARQNLRRILELESDEGLRGAARSALASVDSYEAAVRAGGTAQRAPAPPAPGALNDPSVSQPETPDAPPDSPPAPLTPLADTARTKVAGTLKRIDCSGGKLVAYLDVDGKELVYSNPDGDSVVFYTYGSAAGEAIDCNKPLNRPVTLIVVPVPGKPDTWLLKTIEFAGPAK